MKPGSCNSDTGVSAIVLAAGKGSRFGAMYPKELHCIAADTSLIGLALRPVMALKRTGILDRIVFVSSPSKTMLASYALELGETIDVAVVPQQPRHGTGIPGALRAAEPWCGPYVLVVLADQLFSVGSDSSFTEAVKSQLAEGLAPLVIATAKKANIDARREGMVSAVSSDSGGAITHRIDQMWEKPEVDADDFNGVWIGFAAPKSWIPRIVGCMLGGDMSDVFRGAFVFWSDRYVNLNAPPTAEELSEIEWIVANDQQG